MTAAAVDRRVIVLTGATRGLGRALVDEFAARGHTVLGCGRGAARVLALQQALPAPHVFAVVDVADDAAASAWAARLLDTHGAPHLVINNAALMNTVAPLWEIPAADFGRLMDVNVDGTVNVIRAFLPAMIAAGRGVVANLSSGWGRSTSPRVAPYCASKHAVEGLTGALAQELPAGLAAVAVSPGVVDTEMLRQAWAEDAAACPKPRDWAPGAADVFLGLGPADNGRSLRI
ncbi:MAG: SDR family oxidoreductase [Krumholzibacteria bacterium]|nr:SDR family oxidoreductase [Candidatus Krumholzibacteria bacterium]